MSTICGDCGHEHADFLQESETCSGSSIQSNSTEESGAIYVANGKSGHSVTLNTDDILEGTNKYHTPTRVRAALSANSPINLDPDTGVISHNESGVTANTYGDATKYPVITVDDKGHITSVTEQNLPNNSIGDDLIAIEALTGTGILVRSGANTWLFRQIAGTAGKIVVSNADGVGGNPTLNLAEVNVTTGVKGSATKVAKITTDVYGRITNVEEVDIVFPESDITQTLGALTNVDDDVDAPADFSKLTWKDGAWIPTVNVGIGTDASPLGVNDALNSNSRLRIYKAGAFTVSPIEVTTESILSMNTAGDESVTSQYAGDIGILVWNIDENQEVRPGTQIAGAIAYLQFITANRTEGGNLSAHVSAIYLKGTGTADKLIGARIASPSIDTTDGFDGTIDLIVGHQIDDQEIEGSITTSQGYVQKGPNDTNYFAGKSQFGGTDDPAYDPPTEQVDIYTGNLRMRAPNVPATASADGRVGEIAWDATYMYVCVANNTWKRSLIETW